MPHDTELANLRRTCADYGRQLRERDMADHRRKMDELAAKQQLDKAMSHADQHAARLKEIEKARYGSWIAHYVGLEDYRYKPRELWEVPATGWAPGFNPVELNIAGAVEIPDGKKTKLHLALEKAQGVKT